MIDDFDRLVSEETSRARPLALATASLAWIAAVVFGMGMLVQYGVAAGAPASAPAHWPSATALDLATDADTLLMSIHPRCTCSRASLAELDGLMTSLGGQVRAYVLLVAPEGVGEDFTETELRASAERIPGVRVARDEGGRESALFGARTSGQTYLYAPDGRLLFAGGITPMRGHVGASVGRAQILSLVESGRSERAASAVFGCPLADEDGREFVLSELRFRHTTQTSESDPEGRRAR